MIDIKTLSIAGFEEALHGMRNPLNSWAKSDSFYAKSETDTDSYSYRIGDEDLRLAGSLAEGGPVHAKYRRMIIVYADIVAPLYWWKEFDTYRMGVEKNSCSTMHTIHQKEFELNDFSWEHLGVNATLVDAGGDLVAGFMDLWVEELRRTIAALNTARRFYLEETDPIIKKEYWWQIIQLLPSSYNQKRTVMMSYEAIAHMYADRRNHKLDEWREFCDWVEGLPYFRPIIKTKEPEKE